MGHEYVDTPLGLARIIEDTVRSVYQRCALEGANENDEKLECAMQQTVGTILGMKHLRQGSWDDVN
jgi:hypothetical protein